MLYAFAAALWRVGCGKAGKMSDRRFARTEMLLGSAGVEHLGRCSIAVFGIGGVGSYAAEALARAGVGRLTLVDHDVIDVTNINRQIHALTETVGASKTETMARRIHSINPACEVREIRAFYSSEDADMFFPEHYDYVLDAVDTVTAKIDLAVQCHRYGIPLIASMGAANKPDTLCDHGYLSYEGGPTRAHSAEEAKGAGHSAFECRLLARAPTHTGGRKRDARRRAEYGACECVLCPVCRRTHYGRSCDS